MHFKIGLYTYVKEFKIRIVLKIDKYKARKRDCNKHVVRRTTAVLTAALAIWTLLVFQTPKSSVCFDYEEEVVKTWLPDWGNLDNYELRKVHVPDNRKVEKCDFVILTSGDKLNKENEWLLKNRINYAKEHGYCYLHLDCIVKSKCLYPHYWRYIGIIKIYYEFAKERKLKKRDEGRYLLYLDTDTMIINFDVKINYYINKIIGKDRRDFFLGISVDDNCDFENYIINTGVMILSLYKLETLLFSLQVLTLQKTQSILSYVPEWSITGLNDQNVVILLLNETNRINTYLICEYCKKRKHLLETGNISELYKHDYFRNINVNENQQSNVTSFVKGVHVFPNKYFNNIIRLKHDILKTNFEYLNEYSWIVHLSGSNYMEQKYLIYKICIGIFGSYIFKKPKIKNNDYFERECPYSLHKIVTKRELNVIYELLEHKRGFEIDQSNYIGKNTDNWIEDIKTIQQQINYMFKKYSKIITSKLKSKLFTINSKRSLVGSLLQFIDNSNNFLMLFNEVIFLGNRNKKALKYEINSGFNSQNTFEFFSIIYNKCPIINNNEKEICVIF
ncbi:hypothetical protein FG386_000979 [Cryptosporidium ryanae]|uniref:uncharacterized protein n=1 Tax=Cryptosporidium ryanae TaxID=515981 RepID=UPI00351AA591|nr:hypothetical protein FG386_000979 [Cryptosporidium ryanae]